MIRSHMEQLYGSLIHPPTPALVPTNDFLGLLNARHRAESLTLRFVFSKESYCATRKRNIWEKSRQAKENWFKEGCTCKEATRPEGYAPGGGCKEEEEEQDDLTVLEVFAPSFPCGCFFLLSYGCFFTLSCGCFFRS